MLKEAVGVELGKPLDSSLIEKGLRELNSGIQFDPGGKLGYWHPSIGTRQGVYFGDRFICGMDRGSVPEFKVWNVCETIREGEWWEADKEGAGIYFEIVPAASLTPELLASAARGSDPAYALDDAGRVVKRTVRIVKKTRGRCLRVGWRHVFENLLTAGIPGVTRDSLGKKFGVDMWQFPGGTPEEVSAAVVEE